MRSLLAVAFAIAAFAQAPAGPAKPRPEPKNLKILKPGPDLIPTMRSYNAAMGQKCDFCHVQGDFAADTNHHKEIARKMITMTAEINAKFDDGKVHVTCFTCHRGDPHPVTAPPADAAQAPAAPKVDAPKP